MKKMALVSLTVVAAFAAQSQDIQMDPEKMFQILKPKMSHMYEVMIPALEKTEKCIEKAERKKDFAECSNYMMEAGREFMPKGMGQEPITEEDLKDMKWSEEERAKVLRDIRRTKEEMKKMKECIENSKNMQNLDTCMKEVGVAR